MNKKYIIDDLVYYFDYDVFNDFFSKVKRKKNLTFEKLEIELASYLSISKDAIHSWRFKKQSPSSLDIINNIASFFELSEYKILLKGRETLIMNNNFNDKQINSLKIIYDKIVEYLDYFYETDGYNDLWINFVDKGIHPSSIEDKLYNLAEEKIHDVVLTYTKERFYLKNTQIYDDLKNYIYNDLYDIFSGKLSYAYRFEAIPSGNPTTKEDYMKAFKTLNTIIDNYI